MNPDNWDWDNPIKVEIAENVVVELPIEVSFEELGLLEHVARAEGKNAHAFMKQVALDAAHAKAPNYVYPDPRISPQTRERRSG